MSSEDGYFDGYIPVTKEGLNTAVKELQKELKQLEEKIRQKRPKNLERVTRITGTNNKS